MKVTEKTIEDLITVALASNADARQKHFFRESLRNLVRLAKAEQMQELRMDVARATQRVGSPSSLHISQQ